MFFPGPDVGGSKEDGVELTENGGAGPVVKTETGVRPGTGSDLACEAEYTSEEDIGVVTVDTVDTVDTMGLTVEVEVAEEVLSREDIGDTIVTAGTNDILVLLPVNVFIPLLIKLVVREVRYCGEDIAEEESCAGPEVLWVAKMVVVLTDLCLLFGWTWWVLTWVIEVQQDDSWALEHNLW